ncbi:MAG: integrase [Acidimicrobiaceae bacterium]|nr:integrase [Acidimicrobiaceae bacterium]
MTNAHVVQVDGLLAPFARDLEVAIAADGYSRQRARLLLGLMAEVSHWLQATGLQVGDLAPAVIDRFFAGRAPGRSRCRTSRSWKPVMVHLRDLGAVPPPAKPAYGRTDAEAELLECFRRWCVAQRGLTSTTSDAYARYVATFLARWRPDAQFVIADLDGAGILITIRAAAEMMPSPSLRCMVTALRSFLRFLHATGRTGTSLVSAVPALKAWPRTTLPSVLPAGEARLLVAACDPSTVRGRRDVAVLLLLLRLGLRAGEVARLELDDIDWRVGEVAIRGKGGRHDRLPLPIEVGEAIVAYLREGRPRTARRSLFLTVTAPITALSSDGIADLVKRVCARAGVVSVGPHALRRSLATETLRAGAPMAEVAQLLRHADQATTSIYAAADAAAVAALARPWPEVRR